VNKHELSYNRIVGGVIATQDGKTIMMVKPVKSGDNKHINKGNCWHWWGPERGFTPPPGYLTSQAECATPFRMLKRETWTVRSPKGFEPGMQVKFKYPDFEVEQGWSEKSVHDERFTLLRRWDFPGLVGRDDKRFGADVAWRVVSDRQYEMRIPEYRLERVWPKAMYYTPSGELPEYLQSWVTKKGNRNG
jgi:hypothetical protein